MGDNVLDTLGRSLLIAAFMALFGCSGQEGPRKSGAVVTPPRPLVSPAADGSSVPYLAVAPDGSVHMSWIEERAQGGHAFKTARWNDAGWSNPVTIAQGDSFFVNWADFPSILPLDNQTLFAHWPWRSGGSTYSYDVRLAISRDDGRSWQGPIIPHHDGTPTEHGFVSMVREGDGARVVWLDGRAFEGSQGHDDHDGHEGGGPEMSLRSAYLSIDGAVSEPHLIDARVCDCCQTAGLVTSAGTLVAYRDRSPEEIRDISLSLFDGMTWSEPFPLHRDGWSINACPVNGAAFDGTGEKVVAAWYTEANEQPTVLVAFSNDGARTFGKPIAVDDGNPLGRVDVIQLADGSALVLWLENGDPSAKILLRKISPDGKTTTALAVSNTSSARASGFPRMVKTGDRIVFAWTVVGEPTRIRVALAGLSS